jgi:putative nucleotidyltransferase with HDIG domain
MRHNFRALGPTGAAYVATVILAGAAVIAVSVAHLVRHPIGNEWLILAALTVVSGWAMLRIPAMPISFSISDIFNIAASLLFGPSAGAVCAALDGLVLTSRFSSSQRTWDRVLFNIAAPTIATWLAAQVFFALGGNRVPLAGTIAALRLLALLGLFGAIDFVLNSGIVAVAVSFERRLPVLSIWKEHFAGLWITYFGGVFGAMLVMTLARFRTLEVLIVLVPLPVILYVAFRHSLGRAQDQISHLGKVNRVYVAAIEALALAVDAKDQVTYDHTRRVQESAVHLARTLSVADDGEIQAIKAAALLHDVGKLAIPEHILNKPGRLTAAEYEIMKRHAPIGADILAVIGFPYAVAPIVRSHHENWDGTGYPDGLAGEQIPIGSRILAVVDCFDALTSNRPYRPRMEDRDALQIVNDRRGTMYDPRVVDAFFSLYGQRSGETVNAAAATVVEPAAVLARPTQTEHPELDVYAFFDIGVAVAGTASIQEIGDAVWTRVQSRCPASAFILYVYDSDSDAIAPRYIGGAIALEPVEVPLGERLSGWAAATGKTVVNSDARLDLDEAIRDTSALRSALAVPVIVDGRPVCVFTFYSETTDAFDAGHTHVMEALGTMLAPYVRKCAERSSRVPPPLASASKNGTRASHESTRS